MNDTLTNKDRKLISNILSFTKNQIAHDLLVGKRKSIDSYINRSNAELSIQSHNDYDQSQLSPLRTQVRISIPELLEEVEKEFLDPSTPWVNLFHRVESILEPYRNINADYSFHLPTTMSVKLSSEIPYTVKIQINDPEKGIEKLYQKIAEFNSAYIQSLIIKKRIDLAFDKAKEFIKTFCENHNCSWKYEKYDTMAFFDIVAECGQIYKFNIFTENPDKIYSDIERMVHAIQGHDITMKSKWPSLKDYLSQLGFEVSCQCRVDDYDQAHRDPIVDVNVKATLGEEINFQFDIHAIECMEGIKRDVSKILKEHDSIRKTLSKRLDHIGIPWSIKTDMEKHMVSMVNVICKLDNGSEYKQHLDEFITKNLEGQKFLLSIKTQIAEILEPFNILWGLSVEDEMISLKIYPKKESTQTFSVNREDLAVLKSIAEDIKHRYMNGAGPQQDEVDTGINSSTQ